MFSKFKYFQNFTSVDEVIIACFRRSLCYPLYRNWELSMKVFEDVKKILTLGQYKLEYDYWDVFLLISFYYLKYFYVCAGKKYIIKVFCEIHSLFNNSYEPRYILNQLYIKDFLIWLQASPESLIEPLHSMLNNVSLKKYIFTTDLFSISINSFIFNVLLSY